MDRRASTRGALLAAAWSVALVSPVLAGQPETRTAPAVERTVYDMRQLAAPPALSEGELAGRRLFTQRCAICHDPVGQPLGETPGPQLDRRTVEGEREAAARRFIAGGSPRMPGFQYALRPAQIDQIVAYLSTVPADGSAPAAPAVAAVSPAGSGSGSPVPDPRARLSGRVDGPDGQPAGGIAVSARAVDRTFTTTVFTDAQGRYVFPALADGSYRLWAQGVGFETARAEAALAAGNAVAHAFALAAIDDFTPQLSGAEWLDSLPEASVEDRRLKEIFRVNCTECHSPSVALHNRFDEAGWLAILDLMEHSTYTGWLGDRRPPPGDYESGGGIYRDRTIGHHKVELAAWLAEVRGPDSDLDFALQPRPSGDAARVVVTEYDVPVDRLGELAWHDGSDWSEGPGTGMHGAMGGLHDVIVDNDGNAWMTESAGNLHRTVTKLDTRTGQVTDFKLTRGRDARTRSSHGIGRDQDGTLWFDTNGSLGRIDAATDTIELFTPPRGMGSGVSVTVDADGRGKIWGGTRYGSIWFDPDTAAWKHLQNVTPADGFTYGMTGDADGNGWWSQFNAERVVKGDPRTGESTEFIMRPPWMADRESLMTPDDRAFYESVGALLWGGINSVPGAQAPRRLGADRRGDTVWVPNYLGMNLARIDIRTHEVTYHALPIHGNPYFVVVDKDHNVWANLLSDDRVVKLDPATGDWTIYQLPSIGCETRNIAVDDIRGDIWVPCARTSRVARLQFRTPAEVELPAAP
jgi:streptogramin lyase/mono/diheme cytochrome c family protein